MKEELRKPKNMDELLDDMTSVYVELRNRSISIDEARTASNVTGKVIAGYKVKIDYNKMVGRKDDKIDFLESND